MSSSSSAASARYRRPAALMRGASAKPSVCSVTLCGSTAVTRSSARRPGREVPAIARSPCLTSARFSPTSGTRSATVASATRSSSRSSSAGSRPAAAVERLGELVGDAGRAQLGRVAARPTGCTTGQRGQLPRRGGGGRSRPRPCRARARASTSAHAVMPQSVVISSRAPAACSSSTRATDRP